MGNIIVSKFGSSLIADKDTGVYQQAITNYVAQITQQHSDASHIFVVSGARAMGLFRAYQLFTATAREALSDKQLAGLGATGVFHAFEQAFEASGIAASSYPITHHLLEGLDDPATTAERESFLDVLHGNAEAGIASIINEADAMNDKELMRLLFGFEYEIDNDLLAAHIAAAVGATELTLWKKEGGLRDDTGQYIARITKETLADYQTILSRRKNSSSGRGGPGTTLEALSLAANHGVAARAAGINQEMTGVNVTRVVLG